MYLRIGEQQDRQKVDCAGLAAAKKNRQRWAGGFFEFVAYYRSSLSASGVR
jgi:hypothetical protein